MQLRRLVDFLQLAIVQLNVRLLILIGDNATLPLLIDVGRRLALPTIVLADNPWRNEIVASTMCYTDCPVSRLTVVHTMALRPTFITKLYEDNHSLDNRVVLVHLGGYGMQVLQSFSYHFYNLNAVAMAVQPTGGLQVYAWGQGTWKNKSDLLSFMTRYVEPHALFESNDPNALMFKNQMHRWPSSDGGSNKKANASLSVLFYAPYCYMVRGAGDGQWFLASSIASLVLLIEDQLNVWINIEVNGRTSVAELDDRLQVMRNYGGHVPLIGHDQRVYYNRFGLLHTNVVYYGIERRPGQM